MSRQVRHRVTVLVLGGFLLGAPILTNGTASAEQVEGTGRQVVFGGGGVLGLSCQSRPEVGSMTVPSQTTVRVVNRTGHRAQLRLGGTTRGSIPDDGSTEVVFRRGTTAVLLSPSCPLGDESTPVLVTATPSSSAPAPTPVPPSGSTSTTPSPVVPSGPGSPSTSDGGGSAVPGASGPTTTPPRSVPTAGRPTWQRPATTRPAPQVPRAPATPVPAVPPGGAAPRTTTTAATTGTTTAGTVAGRTSPTGTPAGESTAVVPGVPSIEPEPARSESAAAASVPTTPAAAAEPVAAMEPMAPSRPLGLLAVVATVCVLGVGVGVIRAFVSQRASRSLMA